MDGTPATFEGDFVPLYRLPYNTAYAQAREKFGDDAAPAIMEQVRELQRLDFVRTEAFEEEKQKWKERTEQDEGRRTQERLQNEAQSLNRTKQERELFDKVNSDIRNAVEGFRFPVDDKELTDLHSTGEKQFEAILAGKPKDLAQKLTWGAHMKQRFSAYEPNQLTIKRQAARIAELESQNESLKPRLPGERNARPGGVETKPDTDSVDAWAKGAKAAVEAAG